MLDYTGGFNVIMRFLKSSIEKQKRRLRKIYVYERILETTLLTLKMRKRVHETRKAGDL